MVIPRAVGHQWKFTSQSGEKYELTYSQDRYSDTMMYCVYCNAERDDGQRLGLQVCFPLWVSGWFTKTKGEIGSLREDVVEEVIRQFKSMLFYSELTEDKKITLNPSDFEDVGEKLVSDEFEIIKSEPFQFKYLGNPNILADIHTKAEHKSYEYYMKSMDKRSVTMKLKRMCGLMNLSLNVPLMI